MHHSLVHHPRNMQANVRLIVFCICQTCDSSLDPQSNTYQAVLTTDGTSSYAVFIYRCGLLESGSTAGIGYYINRNQFEEHALSNRMSSDISCVNTPQSPWSNVVYSLNGRCILVGQNCVPTIL